MSDFDLSVFKKYDIRGLSPQTINPDFAFRLGLSFSTFLATKNISSPTVVVSRDARLSSPSLSLELIRGLRRQGINVVDIGQASTPTFYFAVAFYDYDGGIQVTASHNPKGYNGFKLVLSRSRPLSQETGLEDIKNIFVKNTFTSADSPGQLLPAPDVLHDLIVSQAKEWDILPAKLKKFKIVIDPANSMNILDSTAFFKFLPAEIFPINFTLDGNFPAHEADPLKPENLVQLQSQVIKQKADFGIASDGDGDRIFFVDEKGVLIPQAILRGLIAQIVLKKYPESPVCYDICPGRITADLIKQVGGRAIVTPVGHSLIKQIMIKNDSYFSGESSGHFSFKFSYGYFEAPLVFIALLLKYLGEQNKPLSALIDPLRIYFHSGEINSEVTNPQAKIDEIKQKFSSLPHAEINLLDGLTVTFPDYWFNLRSSNTEPKLRLNLEAKTQDIMEQNRDRLLTLIRS
ncbi:phosphomannomutase/phosphoglucomutase [Patescibacteria group bacterium]|nr:phosphomannomutase/phosphoglucomutase [Patescibacteria group bacterium]